MFKRSSSTPIRPVSVIEHIDYNWRPLVSPTVMPFELGSTIHDPTHDVTYRLIQPLGNGSYAVVYMAHNNKDNRLYALKCLSKANLSEYHLSVQRNEAILHQRLTSGGVKHENLVTLNYSFETRDWLFLVLEYCEGQDLYYWLTQGNSNDAIAKLYYSSRAHLEVVKQVFEQILEAVGHCHDNCIAHRDLKPENFIVMTKNGKNGIRVKLTDFGLATDEIESVDFECGSKPYMSYECRNPVRKTYNPRQADVWSLGIIFLNLLYHRSPWTDPNENECNSFAEFQHDKIAFLRQRFPTMPEKVARFLADRVFCSEESRVSIKEWKVWCKYLVERMLSEDVDEELIVTVRHDEIVTKEWVTSGFNKEPLSDKYENHDRKQSWSDAVDEEFEEMDFSAPVIFNDDEDLLRLEKEKENIKQKDFNNGKDSRKVSFEDLEHPNKDEDSITSNSDTDSGFGSDDGFAKRQPRDYSSASVRVRDKDANKEFSTVSQAKVIYCKPRPWGEQRNRGHQREAASDYSTSPNSHWSSYHQRRERLEQRRKGKEEQVQHEKHQEKHRDWWGQERLPGSGFTKFKPSGHVDNQPSWPVNHSFPRRARAKSISRSPNEKSFVNTEGSTDHVRRRELPLAAPLRSRVSPHSQEPYTESSSPSRFPYKRISDKSHLKAQPVNRVVESPKKVTKTTKHSLGRMLEKMVMFNRNVKVGGQAIDVQ
ncbi:10325_t:CDS:2 [Paraglomus occultum]|uniref:non-specific serine/threonine protein kinase n=1 Tax=Paraglomus occultum TaxID=144539 RepID=A0A9N8W9K4_9GLOM|nr:10325_t:CDS:2 [Paraglomus occultum]